MPAGFTNIIMIPIFENHGLTASRRTAQSRLMALMPLACAFALLAGGPGSVGAQSIFTCVDSKGHKLTSDRLIADCTDREQQELSRSGTVVRKLSRILTAQEWTAQEAQDKIAAAAQAQRLDEKRRERVLMLRYPNVVIHNRERNAVLTTIDDVVASTSQRGAELMAEKKAIASEMEFYAKDPTRAPFALKSRAEANDANSYSQQTFVANQVLEKRRVNQRFDEELETLRPLWARNLAPR